MRLDINPHIYYGAASQLNLLADSIQQTASALETGLQTTGGMGGTNPATAWNNAYQQHANDTIDSVRSYWGALRRFADVLNVCGWNWDTAEYNANRAANKGAAPPKPFLNPTAELALAHVPDPDDSTGIGLIIDPLMEMTLEVLGTSLGNLCLPSGDSAKLDAAATAWTTFAKSDPMDASPTLLRVSGSFETVTAPEVMDIQEIFVTLENGKTAMNKFPTI